MVNLIQRHKELQQRAALAQSTQTRTTASPTTRSQKPGFQQGPSVRQLTSNVDEQWYSGEICFVDPSREFGDIRIPGHGGATFHANRTEYGLKWICVGDKIKCHIERNSDRISAIDVKPLMTNLTPEDVKHFVFECQNNVRPPIVEMRRILEHGHDWPNLLAGLGDDSQFRASAVAEIIRLTVFPPNTQIIQQPLLKLFLDLLRSYDREQNFFPKLFLETRPLPEAAHHHMETKPLTPDIVFESAVFVSLFHEYCPLSTVPTLSGGDPAVAAQQELEAVVKVKVFAEACLPFAKDEASRKQLAWAVTKMNRLEQEMGEPEKVQARIQLDVVPPPSAFALPPSDAKSPFNAKNLPIVGKVEENVDAYVRAHTELLQADNFYSVASILGPACFQLNSFPPENDPLLLEDLKHTRAYDCVVPLGLSCNTDLETPRGIIISMKPREGCANAPWYVCRQKGAFVCVTTGIDRTKIDPCEVFWGTLGGVETNLAKQNCTVIYPLRPNDLPKLWVALRRNQNTGNTAKSMLLETSVFVQGYEPVVKAVARFSSNPSGEPLPMESLLLKGIEPAKNDQHPRALIPPHFEATFDFLVEKMRTSLVLDPGQDGALQRLKTHSCVLVQGPPGTGKSFIGCRIVEVWLQYKRMLQSGEALRTIDPRSLPDCKTETITPRLGPIVVITYKNHALDEFLVDLKKSGVWCGNARSLGGCACTGVFSGCCTKCCQHEPSMARVGGRSQAVELEHVNLSHLVFQATRNPHQPAGTACRQVIESRTRLNNMVRKVSLIASQIRDLESGKVSEALFRSWMTEEQSKGFPNFPSDFEAWLNGDRFLGKEKSGPLTRFESQVSSKLMFLQNNTELTNEQVAPPVDEQEEEDDTAKASVFEEMRREAQQHFAREAENTRDEKPLIAPVAGEFIALSNNPNEVIKMLVPEYVQSLWSLSPQERHNFVAQRLKAECGRKAADYLDAGEQLKAASSLLRHALDRTRLEVLKKVDVIGITTTGCAINQHLLRSLEPSILIVEEAAEILEAQLTACMTSSLKQLVLIGDHFQLQPKVDTYSYEKVNHLNISMFQRLVGTLRPAVLSEQRRMKTSLADLVRPFYRGTQQLTDHVSVLERPFYGANQRPFMKVPGFVHDCYFWQHNVAEETAAVGRSKVNHLEIYLVVQLCQFLLRRGVLPSSITVITPYLGQRRAIKNALNSSLRGSTLLPMDDPTPPRVSTVDRFQGDENDIIILSLVRTEKLTDFLKLQNRMIVACSRARHAMVILGCATLLEQAPHWKKMLDILKERKVVGDELPLLITQKEGQQEVVNVKAVINVKFPN